MSLNSLQDDMSRRAASMAAMAKRATNPQDIQAIQKSLVAGVQNGSIQPYVGIPLIQELTKKLTEAQAQMAQTMAGAGMQQGAQGQQAPQPPIAQQVMQQAAQTDQSQGLEALPSNLPQEYAGGGIIAFEEGGEVERYQAGGTSPAGRFFSGLKQDFSTGNEAALLRNKLQMQYGPKSALPGLFMTQTDEERQAAKDIVGRLNTMTLPQLQALYAQGPSALPPITPPAVNPADARLAANTQVAPSAAPVTPPVAAPAAPGIGALKMPAMQTFTPTPAVLPDRKMDPLTDLNAITKDMDTKTKTAAEKAVKETQTKLEEMDRPGFEAREALQGERKATQEKDSAMGRALNLMNLGFGIAGSKERTLAGALGNEGRQGIRDLIQGEAASRAARDRLEDARDNFEQQKIAAKKGNYSAAQTAGREASRDLQAATSLSLQGAQAGNAQAISMYSALQQGDIGKATVQNQGQQLQLSAVDLANRNVLGLAQLGQQRDIAMATLAAQEKRYAGMDDANKARIMQARAKGINDFMMGEGAQLRAQLAKEYGPNFLTATDARSLEAARMFNQRKQAYLADITGQAIDAISARQADTLLQSGQ
jgi:hypothetical protein